jgi:hypothetical protein
VKCKKYRVDTFKTSPHWIHLPDGVEDALNEISKEGWIIKSILSIQTELIMVVWEK